MRLKELPFVAHVRGEKGGMVWGVETRDHAGQTAAEWANAVVLACYHGEGGDGIHLLGPLAKKVVRIAPPLVITEAEARESMESDAPRAGAAGRSAGAGGAWLWRRR